MNRAPSAVAAFLAIMLSFAPTATAQRPYPMAGVAATSVDLLVQGAPTPTYWVNGRRHAEGVMGQRYTIRVHNPTSRRVEAVVSVDGRDVIDGGPARDSKRGYLIGPHGHVDIDGFRLNQSEVAAFRFSSVPDSYAYRTGTSWGIGRIVVALFPERRREYRPWRVPKASGAHPGRARRDSASQELGTEFGEPRFSEVVEVPFVRESRNVPAQRIELRYDDRDGLCEKGVWSLCSRRVVQPWGPPWQEDTYEPRREPRRRYATPPPGWGWSY